MRLLVRHQGDKQDSLPTIDISCKDHPPTQRTNLYDGYFREKPLEILRSGTTPRQDPEGKRSFAGPDFVCASQERRGERANKHASCLAPGDRPSSTQSRSSHSSRFQNFPRSQRWFPRSRPRATTAASVTLGRQITLPLHAHLPYRLPSVLDSSPVELAVVVVLPTSVRTVYLLDLMPTKPGGWHHHRYLLIEYINSLFSLKWCAGE